MSDARLQELHRRWIASGDPSDEAALLSERVRLGQLEDRHRVIVPWLRGLVELPAESAVLEPAVLEEAAQRLSAREAFVLGFDLAAGFDPSYLDRFSADLVAYRRDLAGTLPAEGAAVRAEYTRQNPGLRVNWDPVPELLRAIANSALPVKLPWILNLIPGMKSLSEAHLNALWKRLVAYHPSPDPNRVWGASLKRLLATILQGEERD